MHPLSSQQIMFILRSDAATENATMNGAGEL